MGNIPLEHGLIVASILFALGFYGVMDKKGLKKHNQTTKVNKKENKN
jgi:hypothetical protein